MTSSIKNSNSSFTTAQDNLPLKRKRVDSDEEVSLANTVRNYFTDLPSFWESSELEGASSFYSLGSHTSSSMINVQPPNSLPLPPIQFTAEKIQSLNASTRFAATGSPILEQRSSPVMLTIQQELTDKKIGEIQRVREQKIFYLNGKEIRFIPLEINGKQAQGANSFVYIIDPSCDSYYPGVPNEEIIAKMPKETHGMIFYEDALKQHNDLLNKQKIPGFPVKIEPILNSETCREDGFLLQRKVNPFQNAPWEAHESLDSILSNPKKANLLHQITQLFIYTLLDVDNVGLDLRWENFSDEERGIVLFDFYELDNPFYIFADSSLKMVSGGNPEVTEHILRSIPEDLESLGVSRNCIDRLHAVLSSLQRIRFF